MTPVALFGPDSDGEVRMSQWLYVMCRGCRRESVRDRRDGNGGGFGCGLPVRAVSDPYDADMPEWSVDAAPKPARLGELGPGPWPACMAYEARKTRSDAGKRRGPRMRGMEPLFETGRAG